MNDLFTFDEIRTVTGGNILGAFDPSMTVAGVSTDTRADAPRSLFLAL